MGSNNSSKREPNAEILAASRLMTTKFGHDGVGANRRRPDTCLTYYYGTPRHQPLVYDTVGVLHHESSGLLSKNQSPVS